MTPTQRPRHPVVFVALDGSPGAATALPIARTIAAQLGAEMAILHVTAAPMSEEDVRQRLHLQQTGAMDSTLRIQVGDPATMILQATTEAAVALVVLTTHGRTGEHRSHLGRVAEAVIAAATHPILLVRPEATTPPMHRTAGLRRLLLPLGGARATMAALHPVGELAARLEASVDLLHIANADQKRPAGVARIGAPRYVDQPQHEWPHWASGVIDRVHIADTGWPLTVPLRVFLVHGEIGAEINNFAAAHEHDAIVMMRRGQEGLGQTPLLGAVLDTTPCPVLLVTATQPGHLPDGSP
jgi:nucleotide-binding universal stress UspA family protein